MSYSSDFSLNRIARQILANSIEKGFRARCESCGGSGLVLLHSDGTRTQWEPKSGPPSEGSSLWACGACHGRGTTVASRHISEEIALIHSEVSELLELARIPNGLEQVGPHIGLPAGMIEAADIIIRVLDLAAARDWDMEKAIQAKVKYNASRPVKHGNKLF
ncbi:nucleoside triphosphate pyrophosphohydrolase family protein [Tuwongella immobilis]|uniref:Marine sediment metagenome DNA, contig: S01H1_S09101 n=1 Tax=Tuwongella immobilis TaxID=692036 RepID=A0A6C2YS22_9BACT|nr:hypothetical protein [Tuwongella immobilis]VIP03949.1 Marine sediment metagenome DNA, contig: S01H1_S09101 OS=marine sediment metagenome GN=S01H1_37979 PE=4 SV=1 [Tuwongella immobilis]VTS05265.1 Marine sediment metagenome DNA, contig: S01H1_S09101 OS=marine sediment metagenome GN=S01H1_37979 PE=4 SV=1 [Tuwongella immobilis]